MAGDLEPIAVTNLRRIWNLKKSEMQITQAQAAKQLGWTQGALSQYLNNITCLNPAAVIKLANFLGVDPKEIDPDINKHLPNLHKIEVRYRISNAEKRLPHQLTHEEIAPNAFAVLIDEPLEQLPNIPVGALIFCYPEATTPLVRTTEVKHRIYLIRRKISTKFELAYENNCPPRRQLKSKWLVNSILLH
jgi:transcriptional regulator with XRE-family HTH domain